MVAGHGASSGSIGLVIAKWWLGTIVVSYDSTFVVSVCVYLCLSVCMSVCLAMYLCVSMCGHVKSSMTG